MKPKAINLNRRKQCGSSLISVLIMTAVAAAALLVMANTTIQQVRLMSRTQNHLQGLSLAEAGLTDTINQLSLDSSYGGGTGTLYEDTDHKKLSGNFSTTVTSIDTDNRKVVATGTTANGSTTTVLAVVQLKRIPIGSDAAIYANGDISVNGSAYLSTDPPGAHNGDIISNGNVSAGGSSTVDGTIHATGTISGSGYWPNDSSSADFPFPTSTQTATWQQSWLAQAQAGTTIKPNSINNGKTVTITAPAYISGNIQLQSDTYLTIQGNGIVYVDGDVKLAGQSTLENGSTLVIAGSFDQAGGTTYKTTANVLPTPTMVVFGNGADAGTTTVSLSGGSASDQQGVIYAVNGSVKVAGGSTFVGSLMAGAPGAQVDVTGNYTHIYPEYMVSGVTYYSGASIMKMVEL